MAWEFWIDDVQRASWHRVPEPHVAASDASPDVAGEDAPQLRVRTEATAISRGTERLVWTGQVPEQVADIMQAPAQVGEFPFPVSYGYLCVGRVDEGPQEWLGRRVFGLLPHHTHHLVSAENVVELPDELPTHRALLAGAAETGLNILWQVPPRFGDRVAVIGAGIIGTATALLADRLPLDRLEVVETDATRRELLRGLGLVAVSPEDASEDCDVVFHCSGHESGLARALELAGDDATVVEASWYGTAAPRVPLGADFHARRLSIMASQVGQVAVGQRARRTHRQRLEQAIAALADPRFDTLITGVSDWQELPARIGDVMEDPAAVCHVVAYDTAD